MKELMLMERVNFSEAELKTIAKKVFTMAEAEAFEEASRMDGGVSGDVIHSYAKTIVASLPKRIMEQVDNLIEEEHN